MTLKEAKTTHHGEWIAFQASNGSKNPKGKVLLHNKNRRQFERELVAKKMTGVYITFAGPIVKKGYTIVF